MKTVKFIYLILLLCVCTALSGCGGKTAYGETPRGGYTVVDDTGVKMHFAQKPQRIISYTISTDEIVFDLVPKDRIAGLTYLADKPEISNIVKESRGIGARLLGNPGYSAEAFLKLKPDVIILADFTRPEVVQTLRDLGMNVYVYKTQRSIAEVKASIRKIGVLVGEPERAEELVRGMEQKLAQIAEKIKDIPPSEQVRVANIRINRVSYSPDSTFNDICRYAGVRNAVRELNYDRPSTVPQEQLIKLNPELFLLTDYNYDGKHAINEIYNTVKNDPALQTIDAVKNDNIKTLPGYHMMALSHYIVYAVEDVAKAAYPERFK